MSKFVALIAALFLAAHASAALRTITTTVVTDERAELGPMGRGQFSMECQKEVRQLDLTPCVQYLGQQVMPQGEGGPRRIQERPSMVKDMCCDQLKSFHRKECLCQGLEMEMGQVAMARPEIAGRMMQAAQNLPGVCNMSPSTCEFSMVQY